MVSKMYNYKRAWFGCCSWGSCRGRRSDICFRLVKKMVMITSEIYEIYKLFSKIVEQHLYYTFTCRCWAVIVITSFSI